MFDHFEPSIIAYLTDLAANNDKAWFSEHKQEYEDKVRTPALAFTEKYQLVGDSLSRPPKGYDKEHPLIENIKRKDFMGLCQLDEDFLFQPELPKRVASLFGRAQPLQKFLCEALSLRF